MQNVLAGSENVLAGIENVLAAADTEIEDVLYASALHSNPRGPPQGDHRLSR